MPKSIIGGWRAFSTTIQADLVTARPVNTLLYFEGEPIEPEPDNVWKNDKQINGELLPTAHRALSKRAAGKHKDQVFPHVVGMFASMAMGKDTVTPTGATYEHKIEMDKTIVELPTRTMIENDGNTQLLMPGFACTGFTLSGKRGEILDFEVDLIGTGEEAADTTPKPARVNEPYLAYSDVNLTKGGAFAAGVWSGGSSVSGQIEDFKVSFKNNGKGKPKMGSDVLGSIRRGETYEAMVEATIEIENDAGARAELMNGTEFGFYLPIVGGFIVGSSGPRYEVAVVVPRAFIAANKKGVNEGTLVRKHKIEILDSFFLIVRNGFAANYLATA
jgi:hypothetical protein